MRSETSLTRSALRPRLAAAVCLLAWFAAMPALLPMAAAALGTMDRQHSVRIAERDGRMAVVLGHNGDARSALHRHDPLARLLTVFSQPDGASEDHVFLFGDSDPARFVAAARPSSAGHSPAPPPLESETLLLPLVHTDASALAPRPPPISALALLCLRSISLRI